MITYYLGDSEVEAYCADFAQRLVALKHNFPTRWFVLGESGEKIFLLIYERLPRQFQRKIKSSTTVFVDRKSAKVKYEDKIGTLKFGMSPILLLDSAVHSGQSMSQVVWDLWKRGAKNVLTYTLMLKRSSKFIPTYFGVLVEDQDRMYFQLSTLPNNRLCEKPPFGILKEVEQSDFKKKVIKVGEPFADITIGDLLYDKYTKDYHPYIYEYSGQVAGFVAFDKRDEVLFIDAWATAQKFQGKGIGGALLRWAETWGRSNKCSSVELWAYHKAIETYQYLGYTFLGDARMKLGDDQKYRLMGKRLLHNSKLRGHWP